MPNRAVARAHACLTILGAIFVACGGTTPQPLGAAGPSAPADPPPALPAGPHPAPPPPIPPPSPAPADPSPTHRLTLDLKTEVGALFNSSGFSGVVISPAQTS